MTVGLSIPVTSGGYAVAREQSTLQAEDAAVEHTEEAPLLAAQSFFASKELGRAVHVLRPCRCLKARFLSVYCQFLVCALDRVQGGAY